MKIIVFGATGRVGRCIVDQAVRSGHGVTAFVRDRKRLPMDGKNVSIVEGNARDIAAVQCALTLGFDVVINAIGESGLKPSTVVTDSVHAIVKGMEEHGINRYLGVSGIAEMPDKTFAGRLTTAFLRITPIGNAIRDHDRAFEELSHSSLDWVLAGCGHIADGARRSNYHTSLVFPGGLKTIHPPDVADFIVREIVEHKFKDKVVGIWY